MGKRPIAESSLIYALRIITIIATIWLTVLALPQMFAAITFPVPEEATRRMEVTANSRKTIKITNQGETIPVATKQTSALITRILSASGSINLPKFVIKLSLLAILPSRWSV